MPVKIKFIKDCDEGSQGEIKNYSNSSAKSLVEDGFAEYYEEKSQKTTKKSGKRKTTTKKSSTKKTAKIKKKDQKEIEIRLKPISQISSKIEQDQKLGELSEKYGVSKSLLKAELPRIKEKYKEEFEEETKLAKEIKAFSSQISPFLSTFPIPYATNATNVTNATSATSATNKESQRHWLHWLHWLQSCTGCIRGSDLPKNRTPEALLATFYEYKNYPFAVDELVEISGRSKSSIKSAIARNSHLFEKISETDATSATSISNPKTLYHLSEEGRDQVLTEAQNIQQARDEEERRRKERENEKKEAQESENSLKSFVMNKGCRRDGNDIIVDYNDLVDYSAEYGGNPNLVDVFWQNSEAFLKTLSNHYNDRPIRIKNLPNDVNLPIEKLRKENIDQLVTIEGRVTSLGEVRPSITKIDFECNACGTILSVKQNYRKPFLDWPSRCSCGKNAGFQLLQKHQSNLSFIQLEDLQDKTDNPHPGKIKGALFDNMTRPKMIQNFAPGTEIRATGILREVPIYKGSKQTPFSKYIFEVKDAESIEKDINLDDLNDDELDWINKLSQNIDEEGMQILTESFAPDIHGHEAIKKSIMFQIVSKPNDRKESSVRYKPNLLLIGDPGVAKSVLGDFALKVSTGGRKAVGGGSSAVGITASVVKEDETIGGYRVEPGALVISKDLLFLDELNNLQDEDKPKLQEGMESQTVTINKANLHVQMPVSSGILGVANPKYGVFKRDGEESINEQFNIPTPILNRFDAVFVIEDFVNQDNDKKIANKMIRRHMKNAQTGYSPEFLKKFFAYIKHLREPIIDDQMAEFVKEVYSRARGTSGSEVRINPRFLESLTRLATASAKIRQDEYIKVQDIKEALTIMSESSYKVDSNIPEKIDLSKEPEKV